MNVTIFGKRKQGKSTLALALASEAHACTIIFDPRGTFNVVQQIPIDSVHEWVADCKFKLEDRKPGEEKVFFARVGPFVRSEIQERFEQFSNQLWEYEDISIIVDEAHFLQWANHIDDNLDRWNRISSSSVLVIQTTHRIVDATTDSRYHVDDYYFFYADLPRELKKVGEDYGEEIAEELPQLQRHWVLKYWRPQGCEAEWEIWDNPKEWFIDLKNNNQ